MKTEHIGPDELLVAVKVAFRSDLTIAGAGGRRSTRRSGASEPPSPEARIIYIEPDVYRDQPTEHRHAGEGGRAATLTTHHGELGQPG